MLQLPSGINLGNVLNRRHEGTLNPEESGIRFQHTRTESRNVESEDDMHQKMGETGEGDYNRGVGARARIRERILPTLRLGGGEDRGFHGFAREIDEK